ncbi:MAG: hypothetical protein GF401_15380 [Chitinivibrionales bacterium]|nr:hypothetical protein [Chitinivibrionales bacterium]
MKKQILYITAALVCTVSVFFIDLSLPLEYIEWILYIIPLIIIYLVQRSVYTYMLLGLIAVLLVSGLVLSPRQETLPLISVVNRFEGFVAFTAFTIIINMLIRSNNNLRETKTLSEQYSAKLETANRELEAFTYSVSHDLRNPVNNIFFMTEALSTLHAENLDSEGMKFVQEIEKSGKRMDAIISDLLRLSQISRNEIVYESVDLSKMASDIITELRKSSPRDNMTVKIEKHMTVTADKGLLYSALHNLLGNAWKYTAKTSNPYIEVGAKKADEKLIYYVRDNGVGFDMQYAKSIFTSFTRVHAEKEFHGTGIGLAIAERVIMRHGGKIWAESTPGEGATFYFTIPKAAHNVTQSVAPRRH